MSYDLPYLNRYAFALCGNYHDAEDIVSAAIIKGIEFANKNEINIEAPKYYFKKFVKWSYFETFRYKKTVIIDDIPCSVAPEQYAALTVKDILRHASGLNEKRRPIIHDYLKGDTLRLIARKNRHVSELTARKYIREFKDTYSA